MTYEPRVHIDDELLKRFQGVTSATCFSAMFGMGLKAPEGTYEMASWQNCFMYGVRPMTPGCKIAARARTLRCIRPARTCCRSPERASISPEYEAMATCGTGRCAGR